MSKTLKLLSDSLLADLVDISKNKQCVISKALVDAHNELDTNDGKSDKVTDFARMISIRGGDGDLDESSGLFNTNVLFSFLPKGKEPSYSSNGKWSRTNRQTSKVAKIALALLETSTEVKKTNQVKYMNRYYAYDQLGLSYNLINNTGKTVYTITQGEFENTVKRVLEVPVRKYKDSDYEIFTNNLKAFYQCETTFELVEGKRIPDLYHYDSYYMDSDGNTSGSLWESCMRDVDSNYFDIYVDNARMLVAFFCDKVIGRAIIWDTDKGIFMDRIYTYSDHIVNMFIDYAKANKWMYKTKQSANAQNGISYIADNGEYKASDLHLEVKIKKAYHYYPYMDTMSYYNEDQDVLRNHQTIRYTHTLLSTGGEADPSDWDDNLKTCIVSGEEYHTSDMFYIDYRNAYAHTSYCTLLSNGVHVLTTDAVKSEKTGKIFLLSDSVVMHDGSVEYRYDRNIRRWSDNTYHFEDEFKSSLEELNILHHPQQETITPHTQTIFAESLIEHLTDINF